ncbi:hypothetical protein CVT24_002053 [Panaeolus cyanescens]|uniref:Fungal lipase-type domain-containing protein n=1 Tax=Panaeolus cyanescens TaxID=181874 RepID=A0A409WJE7_9AGAR|nr:hypothetical protein CVT24_002053 [Panaeolus cyanescens]
MLSKLLPALLIAIFALRGAIASPIADNDASNILRRDISDHATSAGAPIDACPRPNGQTLVTWIADTVTDTEGYIARDDDKKEIVIAFRGSTSFIDYIVTDANIRLVPMDTPGVSPPENTLVHQGFLTSWNSVAVSAINTVREQLVGREGYSIVTAGHSLGAALASLSAVSMKSNFPDVPVRMYTYGQPRTGNPNYAKWVNSNFGPGEAFRVTHTTDPVPHVPLRLDVLPYAHHGVEYWINADPATAANIVSCDPSGEDETCANSVPFIDALLNGSAHAIV